MSKDGKKPLGDSSVFQKGRKGAMRVIYGRTAIIAVSFLAQIILIGGVVNFFRPYIPMFFGGYMVLGLGIVLLILNKETTPETKLMWTVITMLLPLVGAALYVYVETQPGYRLLAKRLNDIYKQTEAFVQQDEAVLDALEQKDIGTAQLARYVHKNGNFATYQNTEVTFFPLGEDKFAAMLTELEQAEQFIFMEYFILKEGYMWEKILEILERKVQAGVEVRVMYDGTCAMFDLPFRYPELLKAKGIQCKMFAPIRPILSTHYNNRDHRKILVIDGKVGFTGGVNIGDEYINRVEKHGHWKDTAVMLKGDALAGFFSPDAEVVQKGFEYLKGFAPETILTAILFSMLGYFNGNNKTLWVMAQGLIQTLLVRLPFAYVMSIQPNASLTKIGLAAPVSTLAGVILNVGFYLYLDRKEKRVQRAD